MLTKLAYLFFYNYILIEPYKAHMITAQILSTCIIIQGTSFNFIGFIDTATVCDFPTAVFIPWKSSFPWAWL